MSKRKEIKIASTNYRDRIFRSHDGREIVVVRHRRDWNADPVIAEILADEEGRVYESAGQHIDRFPYGTYTLKEVSQLYGAA